MGLIYKSINLKYWITTNNALLYFIIFIPIYIWSWRVYRDVIYRNRVKQSGDGMGWSCKSWNQLVSRRVLFLLRVWNLIISVVTREMNWGAGRLPLNRDLSMAIGHGGNLWPPLATCWGHYHPGHSFPRFSSERLNSATDHSSSAAVIASSGDSAKLSPITPKRSPFEIAKNTLTRPLCAPAPSVSASPSLRFGKHTILYAKHLVTYQ